MKKKRLLAFLLASAVAFPTISVSAENGMLTQSSTENSVTKTLTKSSTDTPIISDSTINTYTSKEYSLFTDYSIPVIDSGKCGDNLTWVLDVEGTLTISGIGAMYDYSHNAGVYAPWSSYVKNIKKVILPDGLTTIGIGAFYACTSLIDINIPDSVTNIYEYAFKDCSALPEINLPNDVYYISSNTFEGCSALTSIKLPDGVFGIGSYAFSSCTALKEIYIPNSMQGIYSNAFGSCSSLSDIYFIGTPTEWNTIYVHTSNDSYLSNIAIHYTPSGTCGDNVTWELDLETGILTISGTGDMDNFIYGDHHWEHCDNEIISVVIEDGVRSIGDRAFLSCSALTEIIIPDSVTNIGLSAFASCSALTEITLSNSITSIGQSAFYNCRSLSEISIPVSITSIENNAFSDCIALTNINYGGSISDWDAITIGSNNNYLLNANILFTNSNPHGTCGDNLTWVLDVEGTLTISGTGDMYDYDIDNRPWKDYDQSITNVIVSDGVNRIGDWAFTDCVVLTKVEIPDGVTSIGEGAFAGCNALKEINIPDSVTSIDICVFDGCSSLTEIKLPNSITHISQNAFSDTALTKIAIPNGVTSIGEGAFANCSALTEVVLPDSITTIDYGAFAYCEALTEIVLPEGITRISAETFTHCKSLTKISIPVSMVSIGDGTFSGCNNLGDIYYNGTAAQWDAILISTNNTPLTSAVVHCAINNPSGTCGDNLTWRFNPATSILTISGTGAMENYSSRTAPWYNYKASINSVVIENGVTNIGNYAFYECKSLKEIAIPNSMTSIGKSVFSDCDSLTEISIPDGVSSIGDYAFSSCNNLSTITMPKNMISIGENAFYYCENLKKIRIPEGITIIDNYTFTYCKSLTEISIPASVTSIETYAFYGTALTDVYYGSTDADWNEIYLGTWNDPLTTATIHYTNPNGTCGEKLTWEFNPTTGTLTISGTGAMDNYSRRTTPWYEYADQITNLVVEENVPSIGKYALDGCSNLKTVSIPSTLTLLDQYAFDSASQMTDVYYNGTKSEWENISKKFGNTTLNGKIIHPIMAEGIGGNTDTDIEANASISYFGNFNGTFSPDSITAMKGTDAPRLVFAVDSYENYDAADGSIFEFTVKLDNAKFIKDEKNPITVDDAISMFFITTSETNTTLASATNEFVPVGYDGWKPMTGGSNDLDSHDLLLNAEISEDHTQITYIVFAGKDAPIDNGTKFGVTLQSMLTDTALGTEASVTVIGDICDGEELVYCQVSPDKYEIKNLNIKENAESSDYLDAIPTTSFTAEISVNSGTASNTLILAGYDANNRMVFMKYQTVSSNNMTYLIDVENTDSSIKKLTAFFVSQDESKEPLTKNISIPT